MLGGHEGSSGHIYRAAKMVREERDGGKYFWPTGEEPPSLVISWMELENRDLVFFAVSALRFGRHLAGYSEEASRDFDARRDEE